MASTDSELMSEQIACVVAAVDVAVDGRLAAASARIDDAARIAESGKQCERRGSRPLQRHPLYAGLTTDPYAQNVYALPVASRTSRVARVSTDAVLPPPPPPYDVSSEASSDGTDMKVLEELIAEEEVAELADRLLLDGNAGSGISYYGGPVSQVGAAQSPQGEQSADASADDVAVSSAADASADDVAVSSVSLPTAIPRASWTGNTMTKLCTFYMRGGRGKNGCQRGEYCTFAHSTAEVSQGKEWVPRPTMRAVMVRCKYYMKSRGII